MFSIVAAAALVASPAQAKAADDPDLRCYAAVTLAMVGMQESKQADVAALTGLTAIIWYYYGRMETRLPGVDFAAALADLPAGRTTRRVSCLPTVSVAGPNPKARARICRTWVSA